MLWIEPDFMKISPKDLLLMLLAAISNFSFPVLSWALPAFIIKSCLICQVHTDVD